jgi:hypothetical protein
MQNSRSARAPVFGFVAFACLALPAFAAPVGGSGLLGKRYFETSASQIDYQNFEDNGYAVAAAVNVPVAAHLDAGVGFAHNWLEGDRDDDSQDLSVHATVHTEFGALRPFASAELGHEWWSVSDDFYYTISAGAEYPITDRFSLSGSVTWGEFLADDWDGGAFSASLRANYWFTDSLAASIATAAYEGGSWGYGLALVAVF